MAATYGEPEYLKGIGERWMFRTAVAPTTSSSSILGFVSPSTEPENSNFYTKDLQKGKFSYRNPFLKELLATKGRDDHDTWHSILVTGGSVQHLDFLTRHEKDVFKTFGEISQMEIVIQASARQKFIDQSQSLNIMIHPQESPKSVHDLMVAAHEMGIKTMYYQRSTNPAQEFARSLATCVSCEG
jgi:ribonucleoside-diphosphate reductase alpha chain